MIYLNQSQRNASPADRQTMQGRHAGQLEPSATALFGGHQQYKTRLDGNQASGGEKRGRQPGQVHVIARLPEQLRLLALLNFCIPRHAEKCK